MTDRSTGRSLGIGVLFRGAGALACTRSDVVFLVRGGGVDDGLQLLGGVRFNHGL
jgi:hypothetical protein